MEPSPEGIVSDYSGQKCNFGSVCLVFREDSEKTKPEQ